ncbi:hypothetical protein LCGC14_0351660 [marine sediment metagenome]|uniref:Uncharacterized protein n=1 Tax=marine sediment metagenome TaxID=412755 RepID=A0A0F9TTQ3_9ZZZZ
MIAFWILLAISQLLTGIVLGYAFCYKFRLQPMECQLDVMGRTVKYWSDSKIESVLEVVSEEYSDMHELVINVYGQVSITDSQQEAVIEFNSLAELYTWCKEKNES